MPGEQTCCICGQPLPNRFAVAGRCGAEGCGKVFCALHWRNGNLRCGEHGWTPKVLESPRPETRLKHELEASNEQELSVMEPEPQNPSTSRIDSQKVKKALGDAFGLLKRAGGGAFELLRKLKKDKSPAAMLRNIEETTDANRKRREGVSLRVKSLHKEIVEKKKSMATAGTMQKRILEKELAARIAEYEAAERELTVLLENEKVLAQVKGRLMEVSSYNLSGVDEDGIEELIDDVEEAVAAAEGRVGAARDLEKAGRRRENESEQNELMDKLAMFDEGAESEEEAAPEPTATEIPSAKSERAAPEN